MHAYKPDHLYDAAMAAANFGHEEPKTEEEKDAHVARAINYLETSCKSPSQEDELVSHVAWGKPVLHTSSKLYDLGGYYDSAVHGFHALRNGWSTVHDNTLNNMLTTFTKALHYSKSNRPALRTALGVPSSVHLGSVMTEIGAEAERRVKEREQSSSLDLIESPLSDTSVKNYMEIIKHEGLYDGEVAAMMHVVRGNCERILDMVENIPSPHNDEVCQMKKACQQVHTDFKRFRASEKKKATSEDPKEDVSKQATLYGVSMAEAEFATSEWSHKTPIPEDDGTEDLLLNSMLKIPLDSTRRVGKRLVRTSPRSTASNLHAVNLDPGETDIDFQTSHYTWDTPSVEKKKSTVAPLIDWDSDKVTPRVRSTEEAGEETPPTECIAPESLPRKPRQYVVVNVAREDEESAAPVQSLGNESVSEKRSLGRMGADFSAEQTKEEPVQVEAKVELRAPAIDLADTQKEEEELRAAQQKRRRLKALLGRSPMNQKPTKTKFIPENQSAFEGKIVFLPTHLSDGRKNWVAKMHMVETTENNLAVYRSTSLLQTMAGPKVPLEYFVKDPVAFKVTQSTLMQLRKGEKQIVEIPMAVQEE